jgi:hypothetical protein
MPFQNMMHSLNRIFDPSVIINIYEKLQPFATNMSFPTKIYNQYHAIKLKFNVKNRSKVVNEGKPLMVKKLGINFKKYTKESEGQFVQFHEFMGQNVVNPYIFKHVFTVDIEMTRCETINLIITLPTR